MKLTEKILRAPLPDQLKALLEKFDAEFDASHLRKLGHMTTNRSFTRYERYMLRRAHSKAMIELNRVEALNAAMNIVLNRGDRTDDSMFDAERYMMMPSGKSVMVPVESLYGQSLGAAVQGLSGLSQYAQGSRMRP